MSSYESLAASYDELTYDIDYEAILDFVEQLLKKKHRSVSSVLDLACGTGSLLEVLLRRGYDAIGADLSEDMLAVASEKLSEGDTMPLLLCCPMQELELPEPVDLIICCLDSLNYVTDPEDCRATFRHAYANLKPGGVLVFDINSPFKLRNLDGQVFLDETEDTYCVWRAEFDEEERSVFYGMDIFQRDGEHWNRSIEEHQEYAYEPSELTAWLHEAGFSTVEQYGDRRMELPNAEEQRIYFMALKE